MTLAAAVLPPTVRVLERGWVSSNNILIFDDSDSASLIDTGYVTHNEQTLQLVRHALGGRKLSRIINTHLHSDHCGGNALLSRQFDAMIAIPPGHAGAVARWDEAMLGYSACGQTCEQFNFDSVIEPGSCTMIGGETWQAFASPGHDPHSIVLWNAQQRTLISADAFWQNGFGAIFPEVEGESGFAEQRAILTLIKELRPRVVIPGHGAPFTGVDQAMTRAFARLDALKASPLRNARSVIRTLIKFHLLIVRQVTLADLIERCGGWHYAQVINERYFQLPFSEFIQRSVGELVAASALELHDGTVLNRD